MDTEQLKWLARALSRLIGGQVLAASSDDPKTLTADYKGYLENFMLQKDWQEVIGKYEEAVFASLPAAPAPQPVPVTGAVPTP